MNVMFVLCQLFCRSSQLILNYLKKADTRRRAQILHFIIIFSKHYMTEIMTRTLTARTSYKVKLLPLYAGTRTRKTLQPAPGQVGTASQARYRVQHACKLLHDYSQWCTGHLYYWPPGSMLLVNTLHCLN